jgi:hypothetical protein
VVTVAAVHPDLALDLEVMMLKESLLLNLSKAQINFKCLNRVLQIIVFQVTISFTTTFKIGPACMLRKAATSATIVLWVGSHLISPRTPLI